MKKPNQHRLGVILSLALAAAGAFALSGCGSTSFNGSTGNPSAAKGNGDAKAVAQPGSGAAGGPGSSVDNGTANSAGSGTEGSGSGGSVTAGNGSSTASVSTAGSSSAPKGFKTCSQNYQVPATANPYFAGVATGASLTYDLSQGGGPNPTDVTPNQSPVLVAPVGDCITPGRSIYFSVAGTITYAAGVQPTDANGSLSNIVVHQKGGILGKSDITAPINSLLGVFLGNDDPSLQPVPTPLDFSTQNARDYITLAPKLGQVFFIGTGMAATGTYHQVTVPQGATRLYFAIMDQYQWNNNSGSLSGSIMTTN